jgi:nitroreductase
MQASLADNESQAEELRSQAEQPELAPASSCLSLVIGAALLIFAYGADNVPFAAWLAPVFLLRFVREQSLRIGMPVAYVVLVVTCAFELWEMVQSGGSGTTCFSRCGGFRWFCHTLWIGWSRIVSPAGSVKVTYKVQAVSGRMLTGGLMRRSVLIIAFISAGCLLAQELKPVALPRPQTDGGRPLMQVLKDRKTTRDFATDKLTPQLLSNLLWAAFGVNRPDGRRTAPSAMNRQEIDIYVATSDGLFVYDAKGNRLEPVLAQDIRPTTGTQSYVAAAPLNLVYVADLAKAGSGPDTEMFTAADVGFIGQNVYLFCASEGLATVVRGSIDRVALAKVLKLRPEQKIILAQTVGYPKK